MAEFDMLLTQSEQSLMTYVPTQNNVIIAQNITITPTRVQRVYTNKMIVPLFYKLTDENGDEVELRRETREWDVILTFGSDNKTPRRSPNEIIYKGKKLKNKFTQ